MKSKTPYLICLCVLSLILFAGNKLKAENVAQRTDVLVIPIESDIDFQAFHSFKSGCKKALEMNADLVVVKLNTFGGALDAADSIRTALVRLSIPTVAFVDANAASAGALIALACDSVYMSSDASMGAATVVNGAGEPLPEKYQSYMSSIMRATAENHGKIICGDSLQWRRDPAIAASMVNPETSTSFTATQAVAAGYADGVANSVDSIMSELRITNPEISYFSPSATDVVLGFLSNAAFRAVLIMLIIGGLFMEMHTPGLGFPSSVALVAAFLYFLPMIVTGTVSAWILVAFIAGVVFIALELFVFPGFGIAGISGCVAIAIALLGGMLSNDAITGMDINAIINSLLIIAVSATLAIVAVLYLTSSKGPLCFRKHSELMTSLNSEDGYVGVDMSVARLVGEHGLAVTDLRPAGKVSINGDIFDAVSTGNFITVGNVVKVLKYENAQIYVVEHNVDNKNHQII